MRSLPSAPTKILKVDFRLGALQKLDKNITDEGIEKLRPELEKEQEKKRQDL